MANLAAIARRISYRLNAAETDLLDRMARAVCHTRHCRRINHGRILRVHEEQAAPRRSVTQRWVVAGVAFAMFAVLVGLSRNFAAAKSEILDLTKGLASARSEISGLSRDLAAAKSEILDRTASIASAISSDLPRNRISVELDPLTQPPPTQLQAPSPSPQDSAATTARPSVAPPPSEPSLTLNPPATQLHQAAVAVPPTPSGTITSRPEEQTRSCVLAGIETSSLACRAVQRAGQVRWSRRLMPSGAAKRLRSEP